MGQLVIDKNKATTTTIKVINLASFDFLLIMSIDIVEEIAFSNVSTLEVTRSVAKEIRRIVVKLLSSN